MSMLGLIGIKNKYNMENNSKEYDDLCTLHESMYALSLDISERSDLENFKKAISKITATADKLLSLNDKDMKDKITEFDKLYLSRRFDN